MGAEAPSEKELHCFDFIGAGNHKSLWGRWDQALKVVGSSFKTRDGVEGDLFAASTIEG